MESELNLDDAPHLTLVRGEMPGWSDLNVRGGAGGAVFEHLIREHLPDRSHTLVVGPHDWQLVDLVVARSKHTTLLMRAHSDAVEAGQRYPHDHLTVICGDVLSAALQEPADALVALDGLDRAFSVETAPSTWQQALAHLQGQLTEDAATLLTVHNPLGLAALAEVPVEEADDVDDAWISLSRADATRPQTQGQARAVLDDAESYSLYPTVTTPTIASRVGCVPRGSGLEALVVAHNTLSGTRIDVRTTMRRVADAGRLDDFAAGWTLVANGADTTPALAVAADLSTGVTASFSKHGETISGCIAATDETQCAQWTVDDSDEPWDLPSGRLLEDLLLEACGMRDIGTVRQLLARTAELVRGATPAALTGLAATTFDSLVVGADGNLSLLTPYLRRAEAPVADALLLELFDDFAGRLLSLGWRHPWPVASGRDEIAQLMAAAVGIEATCEDLAEAGRRRESAGLPRRSYSESVLVQPEAVLRLTQENEALRSKVRWFERAVRQRDVLVAELRRKKPTDPRPRLIKKLNEAEAELTEIRASRTFKLAQALSRSARVAGRMRPR